MLLYLLIGVIVMACIEMGADWLLEFPMKWIHRIVIILLWPAAIVFLLIEFIKALFDL